MITSANMRFDLDDIVDTDTPEMEFINDAIERYVLQFCEEQDIDADKIQYFASYKIELTITQPVGG